MADSLGILNQKIKDVEKHLSSLEIQRKELSIQLEPSVPTYLETPPLVN
jgi:hypothetical protein